MGYVCKYWYSQKPCRLCKCDPVEAIRRVTLTVDCTFLLCCVCLEAPRKTRHRSHTQLIPSTEMQFVTRDATCNRCTHARTRVLLLNLNEHTHTLLHCCARKTHTPRSDRHDDRDRTEPAGKTGRAQWRNALDYDKLTHTHTRISIGRWARSRLRRVRVVAESATSPSPVRM